MAGVLAFSPRHGDETYWTADTPNGQYHAYVAHDGTFVWSFRQPDQKWIGGAALSIGDAKKRANEYFQKSDQQGGSLSCGDQNRKFRTP